MSIQTCTTTVVEAPADRVWHLLTTPRELQRWSGIKIVSGPKNRPLATGDRIVFRAGLIRFQVMNIERLRRLELEVHFPFGIVNHEVFIITPESDATCRVTYN